MQKCEIIPAVVFVITFSAALYWLTGSPEVAMLEQARRESIAQTQPAIAALQAETRAHPEDTHAWAKLGQLYMETGKYTPSADAFRHTVLLTEGNPAMILQYNKALIFAADGTVTDEARNGMQMVLKLDEGNPEARYFLTLRKLQDGDTQAAMQDMKTLYHELPPGSPLKEIIDRQIGREN